MIVFFLQNGLFSFLIFFGGLYRVILDYILDVVNDVSDALDFVNFSRVLTLLQAVNLIELTLQSSFLMGSSSSIGSVHLARLL